MFTFTQKSFYIIALKDQKQPSGHFLHRKQVSHNSARRNLHMINNVCWFTGSLRRRRHQGFFEDLCSVLPFIKRKQWRTVRELSVGSDHWHKQSKLTQSSYSTCHSANTNRSIWGEVIHCLKLISSHPHHLPDVKKKKKSACLIHINHSDGGNAYLRSQREANTPCQHNVRCQNLPFEFSDRIVRRQMSLEIPHIAIYIILMRALILHY